MIITIGGSFFFINHDYELIDGLMFDSNIWDWRELSIYLTMSDILLRINQSTLYMQIDNDGDAIYNDDKLDKKCLFNLETMYWYDLYYTLDKDNIILKVEE